MPTPCSTHAPGATGPSRAAGHVSAVRHAACRTAAWSALVLLAWLTGAGGMAHAGGGGGGAERGRLLYQTHCVACHTTQMHWRANRRVGDWATLLAQVQTWQSREQLGWSEDDVSEVAHHLNSTIYRLPAPARRVAAPLAPAATALATR